MKTEYRKKPAAWMAPLVLAALCPCVFFAVKGASKPEKGAPAESAVHSDPDSAAAAMRLHRSKGHLRITDGDGNACQPRSDLGLYSGCHLLTQGASYAWIDLDDGKLAKMDENSEMGIRKEGKDHTLFLSTGGVFFKVAEPLAEDESFHIRCSSTTVAIRDACGWVQMTGDQHVLVYLLDGGVECQVRDAANQAATVAVSAGEMGDLYVTPEGAAEAGILPFTENYVAPFVLEELEADPELSALVLEATGLDVLDPPDPVERLRAEYQEIINGRDLYDRYWNGGLAEAFYLDLTGDHKDELVLLTRDIPGTPASDGAIRKLEVFGDMQGHAGKYDEVVFSASNEAGGYPLHEHSIYKRHGKQYVALGCGGQGGAISALYGLENQRLFLAESFPAWSDDEKILRSYASVRTGKNLCPPLPADVLRRQTFMDILSQDNASISYAKLIDLNHDGIEDLLYYDAFERNESDVPILSACIWEDTEFKDAQLKNFWRTVREPNAINLYREKSTDDIYVCYAASGQGNMIERWVFFGVADVIEYATYAPKYTRQEQPAFGKVLTEDDILQIQVEYETRNQVTIWEMNNRFELIEELSQRTLTEDDSIAEAVRQQLLNG